MLEASVLEDALAIGRPVEPHDSVHVQAFEHLEEVGWPQRTAAVVSLFVARPSERNELAGNHHVQVPVVRRVVVKVLVLVEAVEIVEALGHCMLQSSPAVLHMQVERALHPSRIAKHEAHWLGQLLKRSPCLVDGGAENSH